MTKAERRGASTPLRMTALLSAAMPIQPPPNRLPTFAFEPSSSRDFRQQSTRPDPGLPPSLHTKPIELAFEHSLSHRANTPLLDRVTQTSRPAPGLVLLWLSLLNFAWSADTCEAEGAGKCGRRGSRRVISEGSGGGRWGDGSRMRRGGDAQSVG